MSDDSSNESLEDGWKSSTSFNHNKCYNCKHDWYTDIENPLPGFLCTCSEKERWRANLNKVRRLISVLRAEEFSLLRLTEKAKKH